MNPGCHGESLYREDGSTPSLEQATGIHRYYYIFILRTHSRLMEKNRISEVSDYPFACTGSHGHRMDP